MILKNLFEVFIFNVHSTHILVNILFLNSFGWPGRYHYSNNINNPLEIQHRLDYYDSWIANMMVLILCIQTWDLLSLVCVTL